ncbi:MAG: tRNA-dependent cyclodipeptide synthase [Thermodesulfobacteriota bacterium]
MQFESFFNTTADEIGSGKWNPYLGISINNKAFNAEYLRKYAEWATGVARERAAILVVDVIQRINNLIFNKCKPLPAIEKAFQKADVILALCREAACALPEEKAGRLVILEWPDIVHDETFLYNLNVLKKAFDEESEFKDKLVSITRRNLGSIVERLNEVQVEMLSHYILNELPELISGFAHNGVHYNLNVYPGKIASIYSELLECDFFHAILARLRIIGEIACVEAY